MVSKMFRTVLKSAVNTVPGVRSRVVRNRGLMRFVEQKLASQTGKYAVRDRFMDMRSRIQTDSPVIIDGGANEGEIVDILMSVFPSPKIYAFEPLPTLAQQLREKFKDNANVTIHENALGPENTTVTFNVFDFKQSSSLLPPTEYGSEQNKGNRVEEKIEIQQVRLDEVVQEDVDILKMDLQGYELEALRGSENLLPRVKLINLESEFIPMYEGQSLFSEIEIFLRQYGFRFFNFYELYTDEEGQLSFGDSIFLNERYFSR